MGNTTISNSETEIYYPSSWLVLGGPPMEDRCPDAEITFDQPQLGVVLDVPTMLWRVYEGHPGEGPVRIVMESTNIKDVAQYFTEYMAELKQYLEDIK